MLRTKLVQFPTQRNRSHQTHENTSGSLPSITESVHSLRNKWEESEEIYWLVSNECFSISESERQFLKTNRDKSQWQLHAI